ncbi:hypothetical protein Tco_0284801 [Tanacetum coccineum]
MRRTLEGKTLENLNPPTRVTRGSFVNPIEKIPSDIEIGDGKPVWKNEAGGDMHIYPPRRSSWGSHESWDNLQNEINSIASAGIGYSDRFGLRFSNVSLKCSSHVKML